MRWATCLSSAHRARGANRTRARGGLRAPVGILLSPRDARALRRARGRGGASYDGCWLGSVTRGAQLVRDAHDDARYIFLGVFGGMAYSSISSNFLSTLTSPSQPTSTRISAFLFAYLIIGFGVPVFCVIARCVCVCARARARVRACVRAFVHPFVRVRLFVAAVPAPRSSPPVLRASRGSTAAPPLCRRQHIAQRCVPPPPNSFVNPPPARARVRSPSMPPPVRPPRPRRRAARRYNLAASGRVSPKMSVFLGVALPWCTSWMLYQVWD